MRQRYPVLQRCVPRLLLVGMAVGSVGVVRAQSSGDPYPSGTGATSGTLGSGRTPSNPSGDRNPGFDPPGLDPNLSHRQLVSRREDLKKRMGENAGRLLALTRDLQTDLQSRPANDADAKRLDDIAKLARTVRDQMRQ